jgi:hypothetical protein
MAQSQSGVSSRQTVSSVVGIQILLKLIINKNHIMTDTLEKSLAVAIAKMDNLHGDVQEIKSAQRDMATAIMKMALVEERQSQAALAQERTFKVLEKMENRFDALEKRVVELEKDEPTQKRVADWVFAAVWGAVGLVAMFIGKQVGLL